MTLNPDKLANWEGFADEVEATMRVYHKQLFSLAFEGASDELGIGIDFDLSNPRIKETLSGLAKRIRDVADTTRDEIRVLVGNATEEGWSMEELAKRIREKGEISKRTRALTIARTETATATNTGAILAYETAGVKSVEVLDGDDDEDCASVNGQTWTLEEAMDNPIAHPNCTRAFAAIVGKG